MNQPPQGPPDMGQLFAQAQQIQQQMMDRARQKEVEASAGGGMVVVTANGALEITSVKIDPRCVDPSDVGMLQDLVTAAVNQAIAKAQETMQGEMQQLAGGMLPGLF